MSSIVQCRCSRPCGIAPKRILPSTGFRQRKAVTPVLSLGYRPLFDLDGDWRAIFVLPFEKDIDGGKATA